MASRGDGLVTLIGVFKVAKAGLLIVVGVTALLSMHRQVAGFAQHHIAWMGPGLFPGHDHAQRAIGKLRHIDDETARKFGALALAYAIVFLVEGVGLLFKKRWAEWMTVGVTASFIPFEIYELVKEFSVPRIITLLLNIAMVIYLIYRRLKERRHFASRVVRAVGAA